MEKVILGRVGIEIVRGCNFRCKMCPAPVAHPGPLEYMTRETAEMIVERLNAVDSISSIWPFGLGEPLAHPDCYEIFRILNRIKRSKETSVVLYTNASLLSGEAAYALLELPFITQLYISFDGYGSRESYEYLRGAHFHEVIDNVRNFMVLAKRKKPGLYVGTSSIFPSSEYIPEEFGGGKFTFEESEEVLKKIFEPMGVHVGMRLLHNYNGFYIPELYKGKERSSLPSQTVLGGCLYLEEQSFQIAWNGKVRPCCDAVNEGFTIGDLMSESFEDIIQDEKFLMLRHNLRMDLRNAYAECTGCDKYSFGDDIGAAARYWKRRIKDGEITDIKEIEYLQTIIQLGGEDA